jgi:hypothetical protein
MVMTTVVYGLMIAVCFAAYMYIFTGTAKQFDYFIIFFMAIGLYGLLIGLARCNSLRYQTSDLFRIFLVVFIYVSFLHIERKTYILPKFIDKIAAIILYSNFIVIFWFYISSYVLLIPVIFRLGSSSLLLPIAYYFVKKRNGRFILSALLLVASGKRGSIVALVGMLLLIGILGVERKGKVVRDLWRLTLVICVVVGSLYGIGNITLFQPVTRWKRLFAAKDIVDLRIVMAGRIGEVTSSLNELRMKELGYVVGGGHGFSYTYEQLYGRGEKEIAYTEGYHNVHFSPVGIVGIYGIPLFVIMYILIVFKLIRLKKFVCLSDLRNLSYCALYYCTVGQFFYSFAAYTILQEPLLWVGMGALSGHIQKYQNRDYVK